MSREKTIVLDVNGRQHRRAFPPHRTLLEALRDLGYVDVKNGCEKGDCGAYAVLLDGRAINSCLTLACQADSTQITTPAGLGNTKKPHPLQEAFADLGVAQCGYCTPGMIIAAKALLDRNPTSRARRNPQRDRRQSVPLHRLCPHRAGHRRGRPGGPEREALNGE